MKKTITKTIEVEVNVCDKCNKQVTDDICILTVTGAMVVNFELCLSCADNLTFPLCIDKQQHKSPISKPILKTLSEMDHLAKGIVSVPTKKISMDHNIDASTWK